MTSSLVFYVFFLECELTSRLCVLTSVTWMMNRFSFHTEELRSKRNHIRRHSNANYYLFSGVNSGHGKDG